MDTIDTRDGWATWIAWVIASAVGLAIGLAVYLPLAVGLADGMEVVAHTLISASAGAWLGMSVGVAQWLVLRRRDTNPGGWVVASAVGAAVGGTGALVLAGLMSQALNTDFVANFVVGGAFLGGSLGLAQWLLLRQQVARAGWWVLASAVGLSTGLGVGRIGGAALHDAILGAAGESMARIGATAVFGILIVLGYGAITGGVLVWLVRRRPDVIRVPRRGATDHGESIGR
jgi:hypothetical protein